MKRKTKPYRILLYYLYTKIENPEKYTEQHLKFCKSLGVLGRIIIAGEGINGTVSGTVDQCNAYIAAMHMDPRFEKMEFKIDEADGHAFKKMFVRYRSEIVTMNLDEDIDPNTLSGKKLEPEEFHEYLQRDDVVVIDGRNDYEYDLGHFPKAVRPEVRVFKQFPEWIRSNKEKFEGKKILAYCTGGIRCEKLTGLFLREGYKDVFHLHGGIINYGKNKNVKGKDWLGKCYVFDERISVPVNRTDPYEIISRCFHCGKPCDRYVNCARLECHSQFLCCDECETKTKRSCSEKCRNSDRNEYNIKEREASLV